VVFSVTQTGTIANGSTGGAFGSSVTVGHTVILVVAGYLSSAVTGSSSSPTYNGITTGWVKLQETQAAFGQNGSSTGTYIAVWMLANVASSGTSFGITTTNVTYNAGDGVIAYEIAGAVTPVLDQTVVSNSVLGTETTATSGTSGTTTNANEIVIGSIVSANAMTGDPSSPWTVTDIASDGRMSAGWQVVSSTGTYTYSHAQNAGEYSGLLITLSAGAATTAGSATAYPPGWFPGAPGGPFEIPFYDAPSGGPPPPNIPAPNGIPQPFPTVAIPRRHTARAVVGRSSACAGGQGVGYNPFTLVNSFEGGTNGVTITPANSGGASGNAFDTVPVGTGTLVFSSTQAAHGVLSGQFTTTSSSVTVVVWGASVPVSGESQIWFRVYYYFPAFPTNGFRPLEFLQYVGGAGESASVLMSNAGIMQGLNAASGNVFTFTNPIPLNQWFRLEGSITANRNASGTFSLSLYDNMDSNAPTETHSATGVNTGWAVDVMRVGVGYIGVASIGPFYADDLGLSNVGPLGPSGVLSGSVQPAATRQPRRYPARAVWRSGPGVASAVGLIQPLATRQPRRYPSRAVWHGSSAVYVGVNTGAGAIQPLATRQPRRYPSRVLWRTGVPGINTGAGVVQPQPTRQPRRYPSRAVWKTAAPGVNTGAGRIQPVATRQPRRYPSRAVWRTGAPGVNTGAGIIQPLATRQPRRASVRVVWRLGPGGVNAVYTGPAPDGMVQPLASRQPPRRTSARSYWHGTAPIGFNTGAGKVQPLVTRQPRRYPSRAVWRTGLPGVNTGAGAIQPLATRQPRRASARTYWHGTAPIGFNTGAGIIQPLATRQPRRTSARVVWRLAPGGINGTVPAGDGANQPVATRQPRRTTARVFWHGTAPIGLNTGAGAVQPLATRQPRRTSARVVWHGSAIPGLAYGILQPQPTRQPRRTSTRVTWHGSVVIGVNHIIPPPTGAVQPLATRQPRRTSARAVWRGLATLGVGYGKVQPQPTRQPRRYPSRAVWHGGAIPGLAYGILQPVATRQPRRTSARGLWRGTVVIGTQGKIAGDGTSQPQPTRQPRRAYARVFWLGTLVHGANPIPAPDGKAQPLQTAPHRRTGARGVWRGQTILPVASGPRQPRATVAIASRAVWRSGSGVAYPAPHIQPRCTVAIARRYPSRAGYWRGQALYPAGPSKVQPRPIVGLPRRYPSRAGLWRGTCMPGQPYGSIQPRPTVAISRRRPSRAVWAGLSGLVHPLGRVQPRCTVAVPRRTSARGIWRGPKPVTQLVMAQSCGIAFNIYVSFAQSLALAFNIGAPNARQERFQTDAAWLTASTQQALMPDSAPGRTYDAKIGMADDAETYMQGGNAD
jgi:hypothetical protein